MGASLPRKGWTLLTFGAGLPNWRSAAKRLGMQAKASHWFDEVIVLTDRDLRNQYASFVRMHSTILKASVRGYGYWIWKPFLIRELLRAKSAAREGMIYLDAGFELNFRSGEAVSRFREYQENALAQSGLFAMHLPGYPEFQWSRKLTMDRLGLTAEERNSPQIQATPIFANRNWSLDFADHWYRVCTQDSYKYLKDAEPSEFIQSQMIDHRHDQAIFSGLAKRADVKTIADETFFSPNWTTQGATYPLWAARNRTRRSITSGDPLSVVVRSFEKIYSRAYNSLR